MHLGRARRIAIAVLIGVTQTTASLGDAALHASVARAADPSSGQLQAPSAAELATAAAIQLSPPAPPTDAELDIRSLSDGAFATADRMPARDWEIGALAEALDYDADRAFAFVRDSIRFEAYPGVLRGAAGTLAAHAGNAQDRALLLGALLDAMHVRYRFAWGELDAATAQRVAARTFDVPGVPLQATDGSLTVRPDATAVGLRSRRDDALLRLALGDRLDSATGGAGPDLSSEVRHHAWIQVAFGPDWRDEDPTMPDAQPGQTLTTATATGRSLPDADRQTVTIEVIDQSLQGGVLTDTTVLSTTLDAAAAAPSQIFLYFQPQIEGLGGSIDEVLGLATSYVPILLVNRAATTGSSFPVKAGKDLFSGEVSTTDPVIAGLRLRVTVSGPGMAPQSATRILLDRVPEGLAPGATLSAEQLEPLANAATVPDAFAMIHHIAVSVGATSLRALAAQQGAVMDFIGRVGPEDVGDYELGSLLWPVAVADLGLVATSEHALVPAVSEGTPTHAYVASPRVYVMSIGPDETPGITDTQTDLLLDGVRVVAPSPVAGPDLALQRMWYGVLQAALETQHALAGLTPDEVGAGAVIGASLAMDQPLTVLGGTVAGSVPSGIAAAMRDAIADGLLVVVPGPVTAAQAWWTVDPDSGVTRAILDPGLGGIAGHLRPRPAGTYDNTYGKGSGAGSRSAGNFPGQGATNNTGRVWNPNGNGYWENGKYYDLNNPAPPPSRCGGGQEYVTLVGCVSVPMAWALRATAFVAAGVAFYCAYSLFAFWISG